jgi:hypothetical protein
MDKWRKATNADMFAVQISIIFPLPGMYMSAKSNARNVERTSSNKNTRFHVYAVGYVHRLVSPPEEIFVLTFL